MRIVSFIAYLLVSPLLLIPLKAKVLYYRKRVKGGGCSLQYKSDYIGLFALPFDLMIPIEYIDSLIPVKHYMRLDLVPV
jgi:hypothetical protein